MTSLINLSSWLLLPLLLLTIGFFSGRYYRRQQRHSLAAREAALSHIRVIPIRRTPARFCNQQLVFGSVVVSSDYFSRLLAWLRNLIGGHIGTHEELLTLARREALLRMKEAAAAQGADAVLNLKIETVALDNIHDPHSGDVSAIVEVLAYGTAGNIRRN